MSTPSQLSEEEIAKVVDLRRELHGNPELAGSEAGTVERLLNFLAQCGPDRVVTGIGGHGFGVVFEGGEPGPSVGFRSELDAVPVAELNDFGHRSRVNGVSHKCGHEGHAAVLAGLALRLGRQRPARGRAVLLFQPAEETGEGARRMVEDEKFRDLRPDWVFALHNLPGYPLGQVIVKDSVFACASTGMVIELNGATSHAAHPEQARCPALPMAGIIRGLIDLPGKFDFFTLVTVVHARLGEVAFGTTPGYAAVMATLRAAGDDRMDALLAAARTLAGEQAGAENLDLSISYRDPFRALVNDPRAVDLIRATAGELGANLLETAEPFRWSDDFGCFTGVTQGAMFGLGAGEKHHPLHSPTYDFPDDLLPMGIGLFEGLLRRMGRA